MPYDRNVQFFECTGARRVLLCLSAIICAVMVCLLLCVGQAFAYTSLGDYSYDDNYSSSDEDLTDGVYVYGEINYGETVIEGEGLDDFENYSGITVSTKVKGKTYTARVNSSGKFKLTVPVAKIGYKYVLVFQDAAGHASQSTVKVVKPFASIESNYIYKTSTKVKGKASWVHKGDRVKVKIGKKTYTKKIKKDKKTFKFSVKIKRAKAGTKTQVTLVNKFGQTLAKEAKDVVYATDTLRVGMSEKQVKLVSGFRYPDHINYYTTNDQWCYDSAYLYFRYRKLSSWQIFG